MLHCLFLIPITIAGAIGEPTQSAAARDFELTYGVTVTGLDPGQEARIWLPVPPTNEDQDAAILTKSLPSKFFVGAEPKYGNLVLYSEPRANNEGSVNLSVTYRVRRREARANLAEPVNDDSLDWELFLKPDAKVPVDGKPIMLLSGLELPRDQLDLGRTLYDLVNGHLRYNKEGTGWGQGDSVWACDSKYGNCTDFHSLFISLARSQRIPAKFEMGFPLPDERGEGEIAGYHCWAKFKPAGRDWIPVDISEANRNPRLRDYYFGNLTANRVTFTVGRDLTLEPPQHGPPLNYFIYPYVEVDGKPYAEENVQRQVTYRDLVHE